LSFVLCLVFPQLSHFLAQPANFISQLTVCHKAVPATADHAMSEEPKDQKHHQNKQKWQKKHPKWRTPVTPSRPITPPHIDYSLLKCRLFRQTWTLALAAGATSGLVGWRRLPGQFGYQLIHGFGSARSDCTANLSCVCDFLIGKAGLPCSVSSSFQAGVTVSAYSSSYRDQRDCLLIQCHIFHLL